MNIKELTKKEIRILEVLSDNVRKGIPVGFMEALAVINYQEDLKSAKKWWEFWK